MMNQLCHVRPRCPSRQIGQIRRQRGIEVNSAPLGQEQDRRGGELLRDRSDVNHRVDGHRLERIQARRTIRLGEDNRTAPPNRNRAARLVAAKASEQAASERCRGGVVRHRAGR
jgi:hypothetical protein